MKTKKTTTTARPTFTIAAGVGFDAVANDDGYGFKRHPAVAVAAHPLHGLRIYGPFLDRAAAFAWIEEEGDSELCGDFGNTRGATWHVEGLDVPRCYGN